MKCIRGLRKRLASDFIVGGLTWIRVPLPLPRIISIFFVVDFCHGSADSAGGVDRRDMRDHVGGVEDDEIFWLGGGVDRVDRLLVLLAALGIGDGAAAKAPYRRGVVEKYQRGIEAALLVGRFQQLSGL